MKRIILLVLSFMLSAGAMAQTSAPVVTDSRIKTFVYNENDVYSVLTHYGYQSNIEFARNESVQTVSVGDRVAWQVVPAGRRLFIKALEENANTNMTVVTNKRAYQFDLRSSGRVPLHPSEELVYVVRFFYPDEHAGYAAPQPMNYAPQPAVAAVPVMPVTQSEAAYSVPPPPQLAYNFDYTYSGSEQIAPLKIYDDGQSTYFTFPGTVNQPVKIYAIAADGQTLPVSASRNANGEVVVPKVARQFTLVQDDYHVMVFNETATHSRAM